MVSVIPWRVQGGDLSDPDWHLEPTAAYQLMFEFLRLSPSYELARKESDEGLTRAEEDRLPKDFESVRNTYGLCGDLRKVLFREWWLERGIKIFDTSGLKPRVHDIGVLAEGRNYDTEEAVAAVEEYLHVSREQEGLERTVIMAIPVRLSRSEIKKQLFELLDYYEKKKPLPRYEPYIKLECKRLRARTLLDGLRLLWLRAEKPEWETWRLGAQAGISKTYSPALRVDSPRKTVSTAESYEREMMTKITSRAIKKFESIVENAARSRFPTDNPTYQVTFDYIELGRRIQSIRLWEKNRKSFFAGDAY